MNMRSNYHVHEDMYVQARKEAGKDGEAMSAYRKPFLFSALLS